MTINECKSYAEMAQVLGYNFYNGRIKKKVITFCELNNLNPEEIINNNKKQPNKCLHCGKLIEGENRFIKKFCNSSCAASFNNKQRKHTDETKVKISNSLKGKSFQKSISLPPKTRKCAICRKEFNVPRLKNGSYSATTTCSQECHFTLKSNNSKRVAQALISEGRHVGWQSRNIISYPEEFWMKVLENNNIVYKHNFYLQEYHYFLDFVIEINGIKIDLEIDGKQHKYPDRVIHDAVRDINVEKSGFVVYRVEWNNINNENGQKLMKEKINNFLSFINKNQL